MTFYKHECKCGNSMEVIGENTIVTCRCGKKMERAEKLYKLSKSA